MDVPIELRGAFKPRDEDANKYTVGTVLVVGGSQCYPHAPVIAALGARVAGAGLVKLVVPDSSRMCVGALVPEATYAGIGAGCLLPRADVVVAGMGLGSGPEAETLVGGLLAGPAGKLVFDADALGILARLQAKQCFCGHMEGRRIVLTPHEGEAAKLLGLSRDEVVADRRAAVRELARRYKATAVLKGRRTLVCSHDCSGIYENATGNPCMALGGMGDLLAGMIGARWAYLGGDAFTAAAGAVWLHGFASDALLEDGMDPSIVNTAAKAGALRTKLDL